MRLVRATKWALVLLSAGQLAWAGSALAADPPPLLPAGLALPAGLVIPPPPSQPGVGSGGGGSGGGGFASAS